MSIVKIQAFLRAKKARNDYLSLSKTDLKHKNCIIFIINRFFSLSS